MYTLSDYGEMIADDVRIQAYTKALVKTVTKNSIVLDIGTGTGYFAILACKLGARFVYAIEPNDSIHVAKDIARENGYENRIEFIKDLSTNFHLAKKDRADIIISDLRGTLPLFDHHIDTIIDARSRLLKPKGVLLPYKDTLWMAVVEAPNLHANTTKGWIRNPNGISMNTAINMAVNSWQSGRVDKKQVLTKPVKLATLNYRSIPSPDIVGSGSQKFLRNGTAHGILVWFDTEINKGIYFSNAPGANHAKVYGSAFFPLPKSITVSKSDIVNIRFSATLVDEEYIWCWDTQFFEGHKKKIRAEFKQSNFYGMLVSPTYLQKADLAYLPVLDEEGVITSYILSQMTGKNTIEEICQKILNKYPKKIKNFKEAAKRVGRLTQSYSK